MSCITLDYTNRLLPWDTGIDIRNDVAVPDSLKRLYTRRNSVCQKRPDFLFQTVLKHAHDAVFNAPIKFLARRIQSYEMYLKANERPARFLGQML